MGRPALIYLFALTIMLTACMTVYRHDAVGNLTCVTTSTLGEQIEPNAPTILPEVNQPACGSVIKVAISAPDTTAQIFFTTDKSDPAYSGTAKLYQAPFSLKPFSTVKAVAVGGKCGEASKSSVADYSCNIQDPSGFPSDVDTPVNCSIFDARYSNSAGPSNAIYVNSDHQVCIPSRRGPPTCRQWFGRCSSASGEPVTSEIFSDNNTNIVGPTNQIYFDANGHACVPNGPDFRFGNAEDFGPHDPRPLNKPIVGIARTPTGKGYWLVAADGGVFAAGDAGFYGSLAGTWLYKPVVGLAPTPSGAGYWLAAADGGVFAMGDAEFWGTPGTAGRPLLKPVVGIAATNTGRGYWLTTQDGSVIALGDARFQGEMAGHPLVKPIVGIAANPKGSGYWLVAADGGVFAFGDAAFHGSMGGTPLNRPMVAMAASPTGNGYWLAAADGGVFAFGAAQFWGTTGPRPANREVVGIAGASDANGYWLTANESAPGVCRKWFGIRVQSNGQRREVACRTFYDNYSGWTGLSGAILISEPADNNRACIPGNPDAICRKDFGVCRY